MCQAKRRKWVVSVSGNRAAEIMGFGVFVKIEVQSGPNFDEGSDKVEVGSNSQRSGGSLLKTDCEGTSMVNQEI